MFRALAIFLCSLLVPVAARSAGTNDMDYLAKMIACDEKDERYVAQAYDAFLTLTAGRELKPGELSFPVRVIEKSGDFILIERAYYVSPNEMRGFELFIPKRFVSEKNGLVVTTTALSVAQRITGQGITSFTLQKATANKTVQRTGASRSVQETPAMSSTAGSRR